ncbi:UNVERIFIED_CONTAM: hypothetical protein GTU68_055079 [Idotea baltica]|nr:hypothetical protein [Idotea baltica]
MRRMPKWQSRTRAMSTPAARKACPSGWFRPRRSPPRIRMRRGPCSNRRWTRSTGTRASMTSPMTSERCDGRDERQDRERYVVGVAPAPRRHGPRARASCLGMVRACSGT